MTRMWKGPSKDKVAALSDPIACRLARKLGEHSIAFELGDDERTAHVFRMEKVSPDNWRFVTLGYVSGGDVMNTYVNAALEFGPHDAELFALVGADIDRRTDSLVHGIEDEIKRITGIADVLSDAFGTMSRRYV